MLCCNTFTDFHECVEVARPIHKVKGSNPFGRTCYQRFWDFIHRRHARNLILSIHILDSSKLLLRPPRMQALAFVAEGSARSAVASFAWELLMSHGRLSGLYSVVHRRQLRNESHVDDHADEFDKGLGDDDDGRDRVSIGQSQGQHYQ